MFLWFRKGEKGKFVARVNGKVALIQSGQLLEPGLAEVEVVEEAPKYLLVRLIGDAAMLELLASTEETSVRLKTARRLFGVYAVRTLVHKNDEVMAIFYWRGIKQTAFDSRLQDEIRARQNRPPQWHWTK